LGGSARDLNTAPQFVKISTCARQERGYGSCPYNFFYLFSWKADVNLGSRITLYYLTTYYKRNFALFRMPNASAALTLRNLG